MRTAIVALLVVVGAASMVVAQDKGAAGESIDVSVEDADVRDVMDAIGRRVSRNIIVEPDIHEKVTVNLRKIPWHDAVCVIASLTHCEVEERGAIIVLSQPPRVTVEFTNANVREVLGNLVAFAEKQVIFSPRVGGKVSVSLKDIPQKKALVAACDEAKVHIVSQGDVLVVLPGPGTVVLGGEEIPSPTAFTDTQGEKVNLSYEDAPLSAVCDDLAKKSGKKIVCAKDVDEKVTIVLREIPWPDGLRVIAAMTDCGVEKEKDGTIVVAKVRRVTLDLPNASLGTCFKKIAEAAGRKVSFAAGVDGRETLELKAVKWRDAAYGLALAHDLELTFDDDGSLHVAPKAAKGEKK